MTTSFKNHLSGAMNDKHGGTNQNSRHCTENYLGLWNLYAEETYFLGFFKANELNLINNICPWRHIWEWKTAFLTICKLVSNMKNSTLTYIHTGNSNCQALQFSFLCNTSGGLVFCSVSWVKATAKCQNWGFSPIQAHHGKDGILGVVAPAKYPRTCARCFLSMLDNALQPVSIRSSLLSSSTVQTNQIRASKQRNIALLHIIVYIFQIQVLIRHTKASGVPRRRCIPMAFLDDLLGHALLQNLDFRVDFRWQLFISPFCWSRCWFLNSCSIFMSKASAMQSWAPSHFPTSIHELRSVLDLAAIPSLKRIASKTLTKYTANE